MCNACCANYVRARAPLFGESIEIAVITLNGVVVQQGPSQAGDADYALACEQMAEGIEPWSVD